MLAKIHYVICIVCIAGENSRKAYVIACRVVSGMALVAGVVVAAVCYARAAAAEYSEEDMT